jgi:hypothetical protein
MQALNGAGKITKNSQHYSLYETFDQALTL